MLGVQFVGGVRDTRQRIAHPASESASRYTPKARTYQRE